jgi:hypothetical protein
MKCGMLLLIAIMGNGAFGLSSRLQQDYRTLTGVGMGDGVESTTRRSLISLVLPAIIVGSCFQGASAVDENVAVYKTGKTPNVPGQKPKDKGDVSGTKKDPRFLRSLSDCKSQCETTPATNGLARSKEDCLSDCQDICCTFAMNFKNYEGVLHFYYLINQLPNVFLYRYNI